MVLKLALLLFETLVVDPVPVATTDDDELICDDGSSAWDSNDLPNWACTREGCSPSKESCWDERLDDCLDPNGADLGVCVYESDSCSSRFECFDLWLYCDGVYHCSQPEVVGCSAGTCTDAAPPPVVDLTWVHT